MVIDISSMVRTRPRDEDCELRLAQALIHRGALSLERLLDLQDKGWNDESTEHRFRKQRQTADNASPALNLIWFSRMKNLLGEIDTHVDFVPSEQPLEFLDLGCCPGGFSSYILDKNMNAIGTGVSLPVEDGGHEFGLEKHHLPRYHLLFANLTYYRLGMCKDNDTRLQDLPRHITMRSYDIALLDGHQLRTQSSSVPWDRDRLLISQLIIAFQSIKKGGTIVIKLPLPHKHISARILFMLNTISSVLLLWKPTTMHANRGQFYAVAKGVGEDLAWSRIQTITDELGALWSSLTFGGEEGAGRHLVPEDLDFMVSMDDLIHQHVDWLRALGDPLWRIQGNALARFHAKGRY